MRDTCIVVPPQTYWYQLPAVSRNIRGHLVNRIVVYTRQVHPATNGSHASHTFPSRPRHANLFGEGASRRASRERRKRKGGKRYPWINALHPILHSHINQLGPSTLPASQFLLRYPAYLASNLSLISNSPSAAGGGRAAMIMGPATSFLENFGSA